MPPGALGAPAAQQPVVGQDGELDARGDEAVAQARLDEAQRAVAVPRRLDRARLYAARSPSARVPHTTTVRYCERTSFSSSDSASVIDRAAVSAVWARNSSGWSPLTLDSRIFARSSSCSRTSSGLT
jgi:hypothetical protein